MAEALSLSTSRKDKAKRLRELEKIHLYEGGIRGLTSEQLKELLLLDWLEQYGELEEGLSGAEIGRRAYHRIEEAQENTDKGEAPFEPKRLAVWRWDPQKKEFVYTGEISPKDCAGVPKIRFKPEYLEGPNPYARLVEAEPGRRR
jgi:hypothetical protein